MNDKNYFVGGNITGMLIHLAGQDRFYAHHHSAQKYFKILIHGTYFFIYLQIQGNEMFLWIHHDFLLQKL